MSKKNAGGIVTVGDLMKAARQLPATDNSRKRIYCGGMLQPPFPEGAKDGELFVRTKRIQIEGEGKEQGYKITEDTQFR